MSDPQPLEFFAGAGETRADFAHVNQKFQLKLRAFIELCMPVAFTEWQRRFDFFSLRADGITPIMFFLDFESSGARISFGRPIRTEHRMSMRLHQMNGAGGEAPRRRLVMDFNAELVATQGSEHEGGLGFESEAGGKVSAGRARILQVITRPLAPPGERDVSQMPEALSGLRMLPWQGEFPTMVTTGAVPQGFRELAPRGAGEAGAGLSVWGLPNTDINQHVNVEEYLAGFENAFTQHIFAAGLAVPHHRMTAAQLLFRKPFFAGEPYAVRGSLYVRGKETLFVGGYHAVGEGGPAEQRPRLVGRFEGVMED